jgi:hypothetical protein
MIDNFPQLNLCARSFRTPELPGFRSASGAGSTSCRFSREDGAPKYFHQLGPIRWTFTIGPKHHYS